MNAELICNRLLGALLNSGYQGLLLTAMVGVGLKLTPRSSAATRHAVWFTTLLAVAALPVLHFLRPQPPDVAVSPASDPGEAVRRAAAPEFPEATRCAADELPAVFGPTAGADDASESSSPPLPLIPGAPFTAVEFLEWGADGHVAEAPPEIVPRRKSVSPEDGSKSAESGIGQPALAALGNAGRQASWWSRTARVWSPGWRLTMRGSASLLVTSLWLLVAIVRGGNLVRQCMRLCRLKRRAIPAPQDLQARFETLRQEMGLRREARLAVSRERTVPMLVGFHRPTVLLPGQILEGATATQVQHVLRHELGHAIRRDDWANLVQHIIKAGLFFQPAVWWLSQRLTLEREVACDDHVLAATGAPRDYALFLTEFASRMQCRGVAAAPAAWNNKSQLKERIAMLLDSNRNSSPRVAGRSGGLLMAAIVLFAGLGLQVGPRLVVAEEEQAGAGTTPPIPKEAVPAALALPAVPATDPVATVDVTAVEATQPVVVAVSDDGRTLGQLQTGAETEPPQVIVSAGDPVVAARTTARVRPMIAITTSSASTSPVPLPEPAPNYSIAPGAPAIASVARPTPRRSVLIADAPDSTPEPGNSTAVPRAGKRTPKDRNDDALERRVERLERLMEEWLAQEKAGRAASRNNNFDRASRDYETSQGLAKAGQGGLSEAEMARIMKEGESTRERALRDAERMVAEARRSMADAAAAMEGRMRAQAGPERMELDMQRKMLESERRALQKQMESVEKQLSRLKETQDKISKRSADSTGEKPAEQPPGAPDKKGPYEPDNGPKAKNF